MMKAIRLCAVGTLTAVILPKPMLQYLNVARGDVVFAIAVEDGVLLTPHDPATAAAMEGFRKGMWMYRNAMKRLASK